MKRYIMILLSLLIVMTAGAEDVLTLDQCKELALQNNVAIRNASLQSGIAKAMRQEAFTKYFPNVSATGAAFTTNNSVVKYKFDDNIQLPAIPDILPEGGAFPINLDFSLIKKGVMADVNLVQPVFMGGLIVNGNKLAEIGEVVAELQSRQSEDQVILTVEQYYWQLASLKSKRKTVDDLIAMLDTLERQVTVAVNAGVTLRNDLLEVQLRRNEMLTGRVELDNGITIVSTILAQYIGKGIEPIGISADITPAMTVNKPDTLFVLPSDALYSTTDYGLLQQNVEASKIQEKMSLGANLPKVAVGAGYFYHNIIDQGHGFGAIYATVSIPISDWWGGSHSMRQSKLKVEMARNDLSNYSELLQVKMSNAWNALNTSYEKIGIARQSIEQANENLKLNENYYRAGTIAITDLLKAQTLFQQSHNQFVDAYGDYQIKTIEYLQSTGRK
ncbi:MAG: TolC family protein [Bacteroides sp.]|nr:TolC family protein [Bacteroides sp.]